MPNSSQNGQFRVETKILPGVQFQDFIDSFNKVHGTGKDENTPVIFKAAANHWAINDYPLDGFEADFGKHKIPVVHEWKSGFQNKNTVSQIFLSEHIKSIVNDPANCGYLIGAVDDIGTGQPDPTWEATSWEEFLEARQNRSNILTALLGKTHLQKIKNGTTAMFFGGHSITPLHFHQASFLLQVYGKKHASLIAPEMAPFLYRQNVSRYAENLIDFNNIDTETYPLLKNITIYDAYTEPGDVLFIPNNWFHYVEAMESPSLSLTRFSTPPSLRVTT